MSLRSQLIPKNMPLWLLQQKKDIELKQVSSAAKTEYDKKRKCAETERFEREKAIEIFDITTKELASGVLMQLDASLVIKLGDFVNVSVDLSHVKMSHAGKGYVTGKETKDGVSTFIVQYLETEGGSRYHSESGIPHFRLTVTLLAIFGDGPKV
jgi:acetyl-CoA carboxylase carboxyltransferase component